MDLIKMWGDMGPIARGIAFILVLREAYRYRFIEE